MKLTEKQIKHFNELNPFNSIEDIPKLPVVDNWDEYNEIVVKNLIRCGAIPKKDLQVNCKYEGDCRNATEAIWNGNEFIYERNKYGFKFKDKIKHFEDDKDFDVFIPIKILNK